MKLDELIKSGEVLYDEALFKKRSIDWSLSEIFLFEYKAWLVSVRTFLTTQGLSSGLFAAHVPDSFNTSPQSISINGEFGLISGGISSLDKFLNGITEQLEFLKSIKKPKTSKQSEIVIDVTRGISRKGEDETVFWVRAVGPKSKILKVVRVLCNSEGSVTIERIAKETKWSSKLMTRGIKDLNVNAKKNLRIAHDLVLNVPSSYELNRNRFTFRIEGEA